MIGLGPGPRVVEVKGFSAVFPPDSGLEKITKALQTSAENRLNVLAEAGTRSGP
jgi:hypothetical protein